MQLILSLFTKFELLSRIKKPLIQLLDSFKKIWDFYDDNMLALSHLLLMILIHYPFSFSQRLKKVLSTKWPSWNVVKKALFTLGIEPTVNTQTDTHSRPRLLSRHVCTYIDQSQLPVKCFARSDISEVEGLMKGSPPSKAWTLWGLYSVKPSSTLCSPPFSSHRPSSMLMSSGVHSLDVSLQSRKTERRKGEKRERELKFPSFFSHPGLLLCAVQLAVTPDPMTLTPNPWTRSHATPFCVHLTMATPWSPLLPR